MRWRVSVRNGAIKTVSASAVPGDDLRRVTRSTDSRLPIGSLLRPLSSGIQADGHPGSTVSVIRIGQR